MSPAESAAGTAAAIDSSASITAASPVPRLPSPLAAMPRLAPEIPAPGRKSESLALPGSADALSLAQLASESVRTQRTLVVVCADALAAQRLQDEIAWFAPQLRVALFPDWETLPYDHFSPHQDLVSARLATLYHLSRRECD